MPFETALTNGADRAHVGRFNQIVLAVFALYVAFFGFAILISGWRVDELSAPLRSVAIFQPGRPRIPHPFAGGRKTAEAKATRTTSAVKPRSIVAPASPSAVATAVATEVPEASANPLETDSLSGQASEGGGTEEGTGTGTGNATGLQGGTEPTAVPPKIGAQQCLRCPTPQVPFPLLQMASTLTLAARICVDKAGAVTSVDIRQSVSETVDAGVANTVRGWRFSPMTVNGNPVPFCYPAVFVWKAV